MSFLLYYSAEYTPVLWTHSRWVTSFLSAFVFSHSKLISTYFVSVDTFIISSQAPTHRAEECVMHVYPCWFLDAELTLTPNSSYLFNGEFVTFICDMREGLDTDWQYRINRNGQHIFSFNTNNAHSLQLTPDLSGDYQCIGHHKSSTEFNKQSNNVTLSVSGKISNMFFFYCFMFYGFMVCKNCLHFLLYSIPVIKNHIIQCFLFPCTCLCT